ncbi:MAG: nuclear transport factor 2 family protein [Terracidiphilus sp.]
MLHRFAGVPVVLLSCLAAFAQNPVPVPADTAPGATTTSSTEVQQFQGIEDKWSDAINSRDQYGLELVLSPLFVDVSATGDITTRNQQVAGVISEPDKTLHLEQHVITVRLLGDIAVANGTYVLHHKVGNNELDEKGVFTHVFAQAHNSWVCVNSQRTVLREDGPQQKNRKRQSTADMPFHIPLFSRN